MANPRQKGALRLTPRPHRSITHMPPHLFRVLLPVPDIEAAQHFYGGVLAVTGERVSPGRHYFDCGGTILACFDPRADGDDWDARPNPEHIYFAVDDLEATYARCQTAGPKELDAVIQTQPWGERSFYAIDPFGNPVCFVDATSIFVGGGND